jgi:predicted ATP-grasp superfamily ATP-dependent carboligase
MRVLVTDAGERKSLAAVRALRGAGQEVWAAGSSPLDPALSSRYCTGRFVWPSPQRRPAAFVRALEATLRGGRFDVLLPMGDHTTAIAVRHARRLGRLARMAVPGPAAYEDAASKWRLCRLARDLGLAMPATLRPHSEEQLRQAASATTYPCVVKPVRGAGADGFWLARSADDLLARHPRGRGPHDLAFDHRWPLVQEYVHGPIHEVCALADRGRLVAAVTQRRLRSYPPGAGPGIFNETTDEPDMLAAAETVVAGLGWHGPLQVEFIRRQSDGRLLLLEVNPRFWGTLDLTIQAGVDIPLLTCRLATGERPAGFARGAAGVKYAWLLPYSLIALREGRRSQSGLETLGMLQIRKDVQLRDWPAHAALLARAAGRSMWNGLRGLLG